MTFLQTDRLLLRRLTAQDAAALFLVTGDPEVMRYWAPGPDRDAAQTASRIAGINEHWELHGFGDWAMVSREGGRLLGFAGLHFIAEMEEVNVGYALARDAWGRGFGGDVCRLVLEHGFGMLGLPRVVAVVDPRNARSTHLAEGCGMTLWKRFVWTGRERLVYAITRDAWERSSGLAIAFLADHPEVVPALAEWFAGECGDLDPRNTMDGFRARLPQRAQRDRLPSCLLGMLRGRVVATSTLKYREIEWRHGADYWLGSVYVREDVRGRGYCRAIVAAAEREAAARGWSPLYLYTAGKERLYETLGWTVAGRTIADGKAAVVMTRRVDEAPDRGRDAS